MLHLDIGYSVPGRDWEQFSPERQVQMVWTAAARRRDLSVGIDGAWPEEDPTFYWPLDVVLPSECSSVLFARLYDKAVFVDVDGVSHTVEPSRGPANKKKFYPECCDRRDVHTLRGDWVDVWDALKDPEPRRWCPRTCIPTYAASRAARIVFRRIVAEFGYTCQICGIEPGVVLDHAHWNGRIRGLLCRDCNGQVDSCAHLFGCRYADYLNDPPVWEWGLLKPAWQKAHRHRTHLSRKKRLTMAMASGVLRLTPEAMVLLHSSPLVDDVGASG